VCVYKYIYICRIFEFSCAIAAYGRGAEQVVGDPLVREPLEARKMNVAAMALQVKAHHVSADNSGTRRRQ